MTTFAAILQLLVALAFVSIPLVRWRYGADAQAAATAELVRQDAPTSVADKINFGGKGIETAIPAAVAVIMLILAALNLSASRSGLVLTWIIQPIVLAGNVLILHSQLTAAKSLRAFLEREGDPRLLRVDVPALLNAVESAFPRWVFSVLQNARHIVVFVGSVLALAATIIAS